MVAADVAVDLAVIVQESYGPARRDEAPEDVGKDVVKVSVVVLVEILDVQVEPAPGHAPEHAHHVAAFVAVGLALHEAGVARHKAQDARLFDGAAVAGDVSGPMFWSKVSWKSSLRMRYSPHSNSMQRLTQNLGPPCRSAARARLPAQGSAALPP
jgi:hypothetical protein